MPDDDNVDGFGNPESWSNCHWIDTHTMTVRCLIALSCIDMISRIVRVPGVYPCLNSWLSGPLLPFAVREGLRQE